MSGDPKDLPPTRSFDDQGWLAGSPDLTSKFIKPHHIQPDDTDSWAYIFFDYVFPEETWIRGVEVRPSNLKAVHHANLFMLPPEYDVPEGGAILGNMNVDNAGGFILWAPGAIPHLLPEGYGIRVPAGTRIGGNFHFSPATEPIDEQTSVGIYLAEGNIRHEVQLRKQSIEPDKIHISPGDPNYRLTLETGFAEPIMITYFMIHMHFRGESFRFNMRYPDGTIKSSSTFHGTTFTGNRHTTSPNPSSCLVVAARFSKANGITVRKTRTIRIHRPKSSGDIERKMK